MSQEHDYVLGYGKGAMQWMTSRTAEGHGAFLLPYLKPGMRLLDCGCGPGTLTAGFAASVAPGEAIGIDKEIAQSAPARDLAAREGIDNLRFDAGDIYALPYDDASFDVVFASAVLGNIPEPAAVVAEMSRVLKPGGVLALKEFDHGGDIVWPLNPLLERSIELYHAIRAHNEHTDFVGRSLRGLLHQAGCRMDYVHALYQQQHEEPGGLRSHIDRNNHLVNEMLGPRYIELGWCTAEELQQHEAAWIEFADNPAAIFVSSWFEAVGIKGG